MVRNDSFLNFLGGASEAPPMGATESDTPSEVGLKDNFFCNLGLKTTFKADLLEHYHKLKK